MLSAKQHSPPPSSFPPPVSSSLPPFAPPLPSSSGWPVSQLSSSLHVPPPPLSVSSPRPLLALVLLYASPPLVWRFLWLILMPVNTEKAMQTYLEIGK